MAAFILRNTAQSQPCFLPILQPASECQPSEVHVSLVVIFGTNLRNHRKAKHLTQSELAEKVSLSAEMISKIERGIASPSFATIEKLSEVLQVPEVVFFGVGLIVTTDSERTRILSKIQTKLSRLNEDQLVRADKMLGALTS